MHVVVLVIIGIAMAVANAIARHRWNARADANAPSWSSMTRNQKIWVSLVSVACLGVSVALLIHRFQQPLH